MTAEHVAVIWRSGSRALCDHIQSISPGSRIPTTACFVYFFKKVDFLVFRKTVFFQKFRSSEIELTYIRLNMNTSRIQGLR